MRVNVGCRQKHHPARFLTPKPFIADYAGGGDEALAIGTGHEESLRLTSAIFGGRYDSGWREFYWCLRVDDYVLEIENKMLRTGRIVFGQRCGTRNCWHFHQQFNSLTGIMLFRIRR